MMTLEEMDVCLGSDIRTHLPGELAGKTPTSFCYDSRAVEPGSLFVCLPGERVDGHDFAAQAAAKGALAIIAERDPFAGPDFPDGPPLPVLRVENSRQALLELAELWRGRSRARVVGVTGTAGKTSVKEVLASALGKHGLTAKNFLNMNSQIGLSISILNAPLEADYWVMEVGISEAGDMDDLGRVLRPDLVVIVNVGQCHLSGLGGKGVAWHKARLLAYLTEGGKALINADYPELVNECRAYPTELRLFSSKRAGADYFVSYKGPASAATGRYYIHVNDGSSIAEDFEVIAPFRGSFGSENVAAVAGAAHMLGLSREELTAGMAGVDMPRQRFNCQFFRNLAVIDDSYNSNPLSAPRMVESAAEMAREKKLPLIFVMGEMLELGEIAYDMHRRLAKSMAEAGAAAVLWKGGQEKAVWDGLSEGGFQGDFRVVQDEESFRESMGELFKKCGKSGVVLFKGSRGTRMDPYVTIFQKEFCPGQD